MILSIECEDKNSIFVLYSEMTSSLIEGINRISVSEHVLEIYMHDDSIAQQKIVINQIKQFMRDEEIKYTMEIK